MMMLEERIARLNPGRRAKIEARTNELHQKYLFLRKLREKLNLTQGQEEYAPQLPKKDPDDTKAGI